MPVSTKKVSLKRNISIVVPIIETKAEDKPELAAEVSNDEPEKKVIKVSALTAQDRLELRAKKFSLGDTAAAQPASDRLQARAARFGSALSPKASDKSGAVTSTVSLEVLKKRAERFGTVLVPELKQSEYQEKLQKRQERFGATGKVEITAPASSATSAEYAEKAAKRLERFKQAA